MVAECYRELNASITKSHHCRQSLLRSHRFLLFVGLFTSIGLAGSINPSAYANISSTEATFEQPALARLGSPITEDFSTVDRTAAALNYSGDSVFELATLLSQSAATEVEKARIAYAWIAYHVAYDVSALISNRFEYQSPQDVLASRQTICSGYAHLYQALVREMGLEAVVVNGYAKGTSYVAGASEINHAWNAVKLNGRWYLVDVTWGAGVVENQKFHRKYNPHYFAVSPEQLIYSHLPSEENWQLRQQPYSRQEFDRLPEVSPQFFRLGLSFDGFQPTIEDDTVEISLTAPEEVVAIARLSSNSGVHLDTSSSVNENGSLVIRAAFPEPGSYQLQIFAKRKQDFGVYPHAVTYQVDAQTQREETRTYSLSK